MKSILVAALVVAFLGFAPAAADNAPASAFDETILADGAASYYKLAEPAGATAAADSSGSHRPSLAVSGSGSPVVFGGTVDTASGPMPAARFTGARIDDNTASGQWLDMRFYQTANRIECWFATTAANQPILVDGYNTISWIFGVDASGRLFSSDGGLVSAAKVNDGAMHHALIQEKALGGSLDLWLDGVRVDSISPWSSFNDRVAAIGLGYTGYIANVVHGPVIPDSRVIAHAQAGLIGDCKSWVGAIRRLLAASKADVERLSELANERRARIVALKEVVARRDRQIHRRDAQIKRLRAELAAR